MAIYTGRMRSDYEILNVITLKLEINILIPGLGDYWGERRDIDCALPFTRKRFIYKFLYFTNETKNLENLKIHS